jgi:hypothetical protein
MALIYRPCYATRGEVRRAMEIKIAAYDNDRIDRAILAASEDAEALTQRRFYPLDTTNYFDWPNFQYTYPWKLYLDQYELAAQPTQLSSGTYTSSPVVIPSTSYILCPVNEGPPWFWIELRRDLSVSFGYNTTPQNDIAITGTFGYWMQQHQAGSVAVQCNAGDSVITVTDGSHIGAGDVLICGGERMIVYDEAYIDSTVPYSGLSQAKANDNMVQVPSGSSFFYNEVLLVDNEYIMVEYVSGTNLIVKRGWEGSLLNSHSGGTLWVKRQFSVLRGQLGTTAATHTPGATLTVSEVPALVREYTIAAACVWLVQEHGAYGGESGPAGGGTSPAAGPGLPDVREWLCSSRFTRKARTRVI